MITYSSWLVGLALLFVAWEGLFPWRKGQKAVRPFIAADVFYLAFNGHFFGLFFAYGLNLLRLGQPGDSGEGVFRLFSISEQPFWLEFAVLLFGWDLLQWCVHNGLHRVPWLWEFHKVHHSIELLDWAGNWRFHWMEGLIYKAASYIPLTWLGFSFEAIGWFAVVSTFMGNFNHANIRASLGPLKYVLNSPRMHIWHHTHPDSGPFDRNFAVIFSLWDWIFGTAYMPDSSPKRLGFQGMEKFPTNSLWRQLVYPVV